VAPGNALGEPQDKRQIQALAQALALGGSPRRCNLGSRDAFE
jgi:hypothetical protein